MGPLSRPSSWIDWVSSAPWASTGGVDRWLVGGLDGAGLLDPCAGVPAAGPPPSLPLSPPRSAAAALTSATVVWGGEDVTVGALGRTPVESDDSAVAAALCDLGLLE